MPVGIGLDPQRLARTQLVQGSCPRVGAQERLRRGVDDAEPREHAAQRVSAADALFVPIGFIARQRGQRGQVQRARDALRRHDLRRRPGHDAERGDRAHGQEHNGHRDASAAAARDNYRSALR